MKRFGMMCLFLAVGIVLSTTANADTDKTKKSRQQFRKTDEGLAYEVRTGVPVSGVVLYEPVTDNSDSQHLDFVGANRRCNQDGYGYTQNETPGASNPYNTIYMMAGANDYRNGDASAGFYCSIDGGDSWFDALITRGPVANGYDAAGDPVTSVDSLGRMYAAYIAFERDAFYMQENGIYVQTSTNNGSSWSSPVAVVEHLGSGSHDFEDKPYAACDYSSASPYWGNYYITWAKYELDGDVPIYFSRSTNGGNSFSTPIRISSSSNCQFCCPTVGPNGEVYVVWFDYGSYTIQFTRSLDGGVTWIGDTTVAEFNDNFPPNPCGTFRTPAYPVIGCDISGGTYNGWIYVCWASDSVGNPDIFFTRSTTGGATWSWPTLVNDDGTSRWQWWQWMAVHPTSGNIGVSWLDRREDPAGCEYKTYATVSTDAGDSWQANFPVSDVASDPSGSWWLGDYCGLTHRGWGFCSVWVDMRNDPGDAYAAYWGPWPWLVLYPSGPHVWLRWFTTGAPYYRIYRYANPFASESTFVGSTPDTFLLDPGAAAQNLKMFYRVYSSEQP